MKPRYLLKILFVFLMCDVVSAQDVHKTVVQPYKLECRVCHVCEQPTKDEPCLRNCPRFGPVNIHQDPEQAPDVVLMDALSDLYVPVVFSHLLHAQMAELSGGCQVCHHFTAPDGIVPCADCHSSDITAADLNKPGLRGAYHRQCLGCHREWSHTTSCPACHSLKSAETNKTMEKDPTDLIGAAHIPVPEPERVVYETESEEGRLVTFYHKDHTDKFALRCVSCHQKESCVRCHDQSWPNKPPDPKQYTVSEISPEPHQQCFGCHENDKCTLCHNAKIKDPFDHERRTGWKTTKYHSRLTCERCHKKRGQFGSLSRKCEKCHSGWSSDNFNHAVTGLILDENHIGIDCGSCHSNNRFDAKPACKECHEDFGFPDRKPGTNSGKNN